MTFPKEFRFGAATASYQIEGGVTEGGRIPSIWDTFSHTPGNVANGDTGDVACDHFHRWREDVALMKELGLETYRFSIAWPRVMDETGALNSEGIAFYRDLLTELRAAGIAPLVTLYHWDLPQYLEDDGGWTNRATATAFARYAEAMVREFGDLVDTWLTLNEPWCSAFLGYASGVHAPGVQDGGAALAAAHHLNLAHGLAVSAMRTVDPEAKIGVVLNLHVVHPADPEDAAHLEAVARVTRVGNHVFLGPMLEGTYPTELVAETRAYTDWSFVKPGDLEAIRQRLDLLAINYYSTNTVRPAEGERDPSSDGHGSGNPWVGCDDIDFLPPEGPTTEMGWGINPEGLYELIHALDLASPDLPILIAENGAAYPDVLVDGEVHDADRIAYFVSHLAQVERAIEDGFNVVGYTAWSLLDNFEWAFGYEKRFGIVYVDYETGKRTPKDSALWYAEQIAAHQAERMRLIAAEQATDPQEHGTLAVAKPKKGLFERLKRR